MGHQSTLLVVLLGVVVKFVGTVIFSFLIAFTFTYLMANRANFTIGGHMFFSGSDSEELLCVLTGALLAFALANEHDLIISNGFGGALFQEDLAVVATSLFYATLRPSSLHMLEQASAVLARPRPSAPPPPIIAHPPSLIVSLAHGFPRSLFPSLIFSLCSSSLRCGSSVVSFSL
jgi:hypothetical protein